MAQSIKRDNEQEKYFGCAADELTPKAGYVRGKNTASTFSMNQA